MVDLKMFLKAERRDDKQDADSSIKNFFRQKLSNRPVLRMTELLLL